jgi:hypothetical protein
MMSELVTGNEPNAVKMNPLQKLIAVFSDPAAAFENIKLFPDWLIPFLLMMAATIIFAVSTSDLQIKMQTEIINNNERIPEDAKEKIIEDMENQTPMSRNLKAAGFTAVFVGLSYLAVSGALFIFGNFVFGGAATYKQLFALYSWASLIGLAELAVKIPLIISKGSMQVFTSLALLMDVSEAHTLLFKFLNIFDIFTIWEIVVVAIGIAVTYRFTKSKAYLAVLIPYSIYKAIAIGLSTLFS